MTAHEPMMDMFIFETRQFLEQLEQLALASEQSQSFSPEDVNEIFRAMHTIKGSAAMMMISEVSTLAHSVEDIFFYIREKKPKVVDCSSITDLILSAVDFIRSEIDKLDEGGKADASSAVMCEQTQLFLRTMKEANGDDPDADLRKAKTAAPKKQQYYIGAVKESGAAAAKEQNVFAAVLFFQDGCEMEEVRAYAVINALQDKVLEMHYLPERLLEDDTAVETLRRDGFRLWFTTELTEAEVDKQLNQTIFLDKLILKPLKSVAECEYWPSPVQAAVNAAEQPAEPIKPAVAESARLGPEAAGQAAAAEHHEAHESQLISVRVDKLDQLLDLVGELVIAEAMVTQNPDLNGLELDSFHKAARQLHKINGELQDQVMSLRMVPLEGTFRKMNRIVRDMTKKLGKKAQLILVGESTEVDKNVIEHIGDPLMHIIRNSLDHGIELPEERKSKGKAEQGRITLSAQNAGGEVVLRIADDGAGLNREKILARARQNHLFSKPEEELTDAEIYSFIFAPGFSTKEKVTEFSGRGVGMDVVMQNIKTLGGKVLVDSVPGEGSTTTIRIPLTLAIIEGMSLAVGQSAYTLPITSVRQSFRPAAEEVFQDPDGSEMIMVRGECYPIIRLHALYHVEGAVTDFTQGILVLVENDGQAMCVFADRLLGVQEIVVKPVPKFIQQVSNTKGIIGCTLLGNGKISLILDAARLSQAIYT